MSKSTLSETVARFKAVCPVCFQAIRKGEPIRLYREMKGRKRWAHANCYHAPDEAIEGEPADLSSDAKELIATLASRLEQIEAKLAEVEQNGGGTKVIEVRKPKGKPVKIEGSVHPVFEGCSSWPRPASTSSSLARLAAASRTWLARSPRPWSWSSALSRARRA